MPRTPRFFSGHEFATVEAIAAQIVPQPVNRPPVPVAALVDAKLLDDIQDGFREQDMSRQQTAWQRGLQARDAEAEAAHGSIFRALSADRQCDLLLQMKQGTLKHDAWGGMSPANFFKQRPLHDVVVGYWSYPTAWNEIGWGGPASPRGYVRPLYGLRRAGPPALAYRAIPLQSAYCAAKFAVRGFTDALRSELLHDGLACTSRWCSCPR